MTLTLEAAGFLQPWESVEAFEKLRRELLDFYQPADAVERYSVDDMIRARWMIGRLTVFKDTMIRLQQRKFNPGEADDPQADLLAELACIKASDNIGAMYDRQIARQRRSFKMAQDTFFHLRDSAAPKNSPKKREKAA